MFLIGQNKIIAYIKKQPEAAADLILWLTAYRTRKGNFFNANLKCRNGTGGGSAGEYFIELVINNSAKAQLITWVGTGAEQMLRQKRKTENLIKYYEKRGIELERVSVTSYKLIEQTEGNQQKVVDRQPDFVNTPPINTGLKDKLACLNLNINLTSLRYFKTEEEYEIGLKRAIKLFKSRPYRQDFLELAMLLLEVDHYERTELNWPEVDPLEFVKRRLTLFKMTYTDFRDIFSTESEFDFYLAGKLELDSAAINKINNRLGLMAGVKNV